MQTIMGTQQEDEEVDIVPMTSAKCSLLIYGYTRLVCKTHSTPSDIVRLCVSFYSIWFDLKIVYCDDETGQIDLKNYEIKPIPLYSIITLKQVYEEIEDNMYRDVVSNEYDKLCKPFLQIHGEKDELIKEIMSKKFGYMQDKFEELSWTDAPGIRKRNPLIHFWLGFKHIKTMYPINTETITLSQELYDNECDDRWVEVPDDYLAEMSLAKMKETDPNFDCLVIERFNVSDWIEGTGTWPRAKEADWRDMIKIGDIVEVKDDQGKDYESMVRYVYPNDHETMSGKCIIHYIGWHKKWDEALDISSDRIMKRYTNCSGPHRSASFEQMMMHRKLSPLRLSETYLSYFDYCEQSQGDMDLQRAIAASLSPLSL